MLGRSAWEGCDLQHRPGVISIAYGPPTPWSVTGKEFLCWMVIKGELLIIN